MSVFLCSVDVNQGHTRWHVRGRTQPITRNNQLLPARRIKRSVRPIWSPSFAVRTRERLSRGLVDWLSYGWQGHLERRCATNNKRLGEKRSKSVVDVKKSQLDVGSLNRPCPLVYIEEVVLSQYETPSYCNLQIFHVKNRSKTDLKTKPTRNNRQS